MVGSGPGDGFARVEVAVREVRADGTDGRCRGPSRRAAALHLAGRAKLEHGAQVGEGFGLRQPHPVFAVAVVRVGGGVHVLFLRRRYASTHSAVWQSTVV